MKMPQRKAITLMVSALILAAGAGPALADEDYSNHAARGAITKLFRGIVNATTGWIEIPKQISLEWQNAGAGRGATVGFAKGIGWAIARSVMGAYEIVTFPVPVPEGYRHIMDPEYVLSDMEPGSSSP